MSTGPHSNRTARSDEYAELRALYDRAFREWAEERRRADYGRPDHQAQTAYVAVRQRRDALAEFLIGPHHAHVSISQVQDAAYFIWLNAGCPSGTTASDWFRAEKQLSAVYGGSFRHSHCAC